MAKRKSTKGPKKNELENTTQKTKDRVSRTPLNTGVNAGILEGKNMRKGLFVNEPPTSRSLDD